MNARVAVLLLFVMFASVALVGTSLALLHDHLARRVREARWRAGARARGSVLECRQLARQEDLAPARAGGKTRA